MSIEYKQLGVMKSTKETGIPAKNVKRNALPRQSLLITTNRSFLFQNYDILYLMA